jgi:histone-lysine N-methyltransferase SETMAR
MHAVFFSQNGLLLDHPVLTGVAVNGQYYCTFLQDKVRPALHHELLERGITLLQDNAKHHNHDVQNLVHRWGWEVLARPPYSPDLPPCGYWLPPHVKEHLQGK